MKRFLNSRVWIFAPALALAITVPAVTASAHHGDCGQPVSMGNRPAASDALVVLKVSVGAGQCGDTNTDCDCDVDDSGRVTSGDALVVLRSSVGFPMHMSCAPGCVPPTTTTMPGQTTTTILGELTTTTQPSGETTTTLPSQVTTVCCIASFGDDNEDQPPTGVAKCEEDTENCTQNGGVLVQVNVPSGSGDDQGDDDNQGDEDGSDACDVTPDPCANVMLPPPVPCCVTGENDNEDDIGTSVGSISMSTEVETVQCKALPSALCSQIGTSPVNGACAFTDESGNPGSIPCP
ncbi:MAG TPA: hypothetical protein VGK20_01480 [Candidatus Binatia bacterium]